ncbi:hypothetical protein FF1_032707 [Malus domestica]
MEHLEPVNYGHGSYITREGEPLDMMLFITQGTVLTYKTSSIGGESGSSSTTHLEKGDIYGKELIDQTVKSHEKVEVFAIRAARLKRIVSDFSTHFNREDITMVEIN